MQVNKLYMIRSLPRVVPYCFIVTRNVLEIYILGACKYNKVVVGSGSEGASKCMGEGVTCGL